VSFGTIWSLAASNDLDANSTLLECPAIKRSLDRYSAAGRSWLCSAALLPLVFSFSPKSPIASPAIYGGWAMRNVELFRRRAEECLERASKVSERQMVRLLLVQAHNHLKQAEEIEAQELNARG
jgi:hypothetical protein